MKGATNKPSAGAGHHIVSISCNELHVVVNSRREKLRCLSYLGRLSYLSKHTGDTVYVNSAHDTVAFGCLHFNSEYHKLTLLSQSCEQLLHTQI